MYERYKERERLRFKAMSQRDFQYDLFISFADADASWVLGYLLPALGLPKERVITQQSVAGAESFRPGALVVEEFERAVINSCYTVLVLSSAYLNDKWSMFGQRLASYASIAEQSERVIPLTKEQCETPLNIDFRVHLDVSGENNWNAGASHLRALLNQTPQVPERIQCPFPGMVPFDCKDARFFYGREAEIKQMLQHLRHQRCLFVVGPSGSGKSSLISAGLLPRLSEASYFDRDFWLVRAFRPSDRPLQNLTDAIGGDCAYPKELLDDLLRSHPPAKRVLLVVDQFEELFAQTELLEQQRFIVALKALLKVDECALLIAMRADFYPELMVSDLWPLDPSQRLELAPLRGEALRKAIQQPVVDVGAYLETGLLERLLADAADERGVLPLLQETMVLLWSDMLHRLIPLSAYEGLASGGHSGLAVAVATKADATLAKLSSGQRAIARRIFLRLIQFGEERPDTRRQQRVAALRSANDEARLFDETLHYLTDHRLLTLSSEPGSTERKIDIAHEGLIAGWPTLRNWVVERREAEQSRRRLEGRATEWVRLGEGGGGLLDQLELLEAERLISSADACDLGYTETVVAWMQASRSAIQKAQQEQERARERELEQGKALANAERGRIKVLRYSRGLLAVLLAVAVGVAILTNYQTVETKRLRMVSIAQGLAAQALNEKSMQQDERAALLVRQAYLFNEQHQGQLHSQIDDVFRNVLGGHFFSRSSQCHSGSVMSMAFSPEGQTLRSVSRDGNLCVWDMRQPHAAESLLAGYEQPDEGDFSFAMVLSGNGNILASSGVMNFARIWNLGRPTDAPRVLRGKGPISLTADGEKLASTQGKGTILLWNVGRSDAPTELRGHKGLVTALTFSAGGEALASGSLDNTLRLWDLQAPRPLPVLIGKQGDHNIFTPWILRFSPDGRALASSTTGDGTVRLWNLRNLAAAPMVLRGHQDRVISLAFSPDGQMLASGDHSGALRLWHLHQKSLASDVLRDSGRIIESLVFSPNSQTLATGDETGTVRVWDLRPPSGDPIILVDETAENAYDSLVAIQPDGKIVATATADGIVRLWDLRRPHAPLVTLRDPYTDIPNLEHFVSMKSVAFSPDKKFLASGDAAGTVRLWDLRRPSVPPTRLWGNNGLVSSVAFSPDSLTLAAGGEDNLVRVWDLNRLAAAPRVLSGHEGLVWSVAFSPDGSILASGSADKTVRLWDVRQSLEVLATLKGHDGWVMSVDFSRDGRILASGSQDKTVRLWEVHRPTAVPKVLTGHEDLVESVSFSPAFPFLASSSNDGTIRVWDLAQPRKPTISVLRGHQNWVLSVAFDPDGNSLVSGGEDGTTRIWIPTAKVLADRVCENVRRNLTASEWRHFVGSDISYERTCPTMPSGGGTADAPTTVVMPRE